MLPGLIVDLNTVTESGDHHGIRKNIQQSAEDAPEKETGGEAQAGTNTSSTADCVGRRC